VAHPPGMPAAAQTVLLYAAIVGLAARPALLLSGLGALWGMSLFFVLVYPASGYRHQAILVVFLLSLYWVMLGRRSAGKVPHASVTVSDAGNAAAFSPIRRRGGRRVITDLFTLSFHAALPILLLINCVVGVRLLSQDFQGPATSAAALGEALRGATELAAAIVIPEPDHIAEALPYYADNAIYLLRERRFGKFSTWPKDSIRELSLGDLLAEARSLHARSGRPVVVVLQWPLSPDLVGEVFDDSGLGWHFSYSAADLAAFSRAAQEIDLGRPGFYESFHAYLVR